MFSQFFHISELDSSQSSHNICLSACHMCYGIRPVSCYPHFQPRTSTALPPRNTSKDIWIRKRQLQTIQLYILKIHKRKTESQIPPYQPLPFFLISAQQHTHGTE